MRITPDTNVLVRAVVRDDETQADIADQLLREADLIAISTPCLCEFIWVLRRVYRFDKAAISSAVQALLGIEKVVMNRPAVEAGLAILEAGGDFADGIIAYEGHSLGGECFASFDKAAVKRLLADGHQAQLLA